MEGWIDKHFKILLFIFGIIVLIQGAVYCWRMPKEFRHSIIPRLEEYMVKFEKMDKRVDLLMDLEEERARLQGEQKLIIYLGDLTLGVREFEEQFF